MISFMRTFLIKVLLVCAVSSASLITAEDADNDTHSINFHNVMMEEFVRFVSKVSNVNFIYDHKELQFPVSLTSGKPMTSENILAALIEMLRVRGYFVMQKDGYYVIHRNELAQLADEAETKAQELASAPIIEEIKPVLPLLPPEAPPRQFMVHKLQYQQGSDVEAAIKKIGQDLITHPNESPSLIKAIQSVQWVKATNSILASGEEAALASLKKLIESIDAPLKQVFIEVLVIETDVRGSLDFGLEWAAEGAWDGKVSGRTGNFAPRSTLGQKSLSGGIGQFPLNAGFNLGVIGNMILHKGKSYFSLGSLVSALQVDGDSTIVLNQKIITQDNKNSKIFVGDNIPFTGSVVQTVGASEQTTANIEYRDVGVSLSITPMLGDDDVITLEIQQEITEALPEMGQPNALSAVGGIRTTKTDMSTQVHVPDRNFLVLTGMMRNHSSRRNSQIPCLGGLPLIGAAFSKKSRNDDKKNVIIYVRPQIIHSVEEYKKITQTQEEIVRRESAPLDFDRALKATKENEALCPQ